MERSPKERQNRHEPDDSPIADVLGYWLSQREMSYTVAPITQAASPAQSVPTSSAAFACCKR